MVELTLSTLWAVPYFGQLWLQTYHFHFLLYNLELDGTRKKNPADYWTKFHR